MAVQFSSGDLVMLRSGGSLMTVDYVDTNATVVCVWHSADGTPQRESYSEPSLVHQESQGGDPPPTPFLPSAP